jgi:outer membrane protein assembly factor BamB
MTEKLILTLACCFLPVLTGVAGDQPQWGQGWNRNMVSPERGLPDSFDAATGKNILWSAELGTETHSSPVIAGGRVYIGTNNGHPRDPRHDGDRGVLMCFEEATGKFLWQLVVPKRIEDIYFDWPNSGISSPATVEGDRVYIVNNRGEVLCLDARGMANGNDGPFREEGRHMTPKSLPDALSPSASDADILWLFDLTSGAGIWSHDAAHSSILIRGDYLYLNTGTGVDNTHRKIRTPDAPSLVVLDKHTGKLLAREREGIAPSIFHSTWSAPSLAEAGGRAQVFFAAGNGVVYSFEPLGPNHVAAAEPAALRKLWQFDFDPGAPKTNVYRFITNRRESPSNFYGMPVVIDDRLYLAGGATSGGARTKPGSSASMRGPASRRENACIGPTPCKSMCWEPRPCPGAWCTSPTADGSFIAWTRKPGSPAGPMRSRAKSGRRHLPPTARSISARAREVSTFLPQAGTRSC